MKVTPAHLLSIPHDRFPADLFHREQELKEYFADLIPSIEQSEQGWTVRLGWPNDEDFFVDTELTKNLNWWRSGVPLGGLRQEVYWSSTGQVSLDDAWTLYAWSRWLQQKLSINDLPSEVVVVHVDDHTDMMCPLIVQSDREWIDLLTGKTISVFDPPSVQSAVLSGAIGIGSFFTMLIHALPLVHVRHLKQSAPRDRCERFIVKSYKEDTLLQCGQPRPQTHMIETQDNRDDICGSYLRSHRYGDCLSGLPNCPVLLHIDMDYFNNRYDRDSDWPKRPRKHDPSREEMLSQIDRLFDALVEYEVAQRIENVTVALSPGFFPSEYWQVCMERVEKRLLSLGLTLGRGTRQE